MWVSMWHSISVFVYICPPHCERNSAHIVRTFPSSFRCVFDIVAHNVAGKSKILQYVGVWSFSQFLIIFVVHSIQFFIVSSKISKFLKLDQNYVFRQCFYWNYFFEGRNVKRLWEVFRVHLDLCLTICSQCERNSAHIVAHNVAGMWRLCELK